MKKQKAFTLIEIVIYIALTAIILVALINISWNVFNARTRAKVSAELTYNGQIVLDNFVNSVHEAAEVVTNKSTFGTNPGVLELDSADDIIIDTYTKTVPLGDGTVDITKVRIQKGVKAAQDLTSDLVDITNLVFTDLTRGSEKENIKMEITLEHIHADYDVDRDKSLDLETSASIKIPS